MTLSAMRISNAFPDSMYHLFSRVFVLGIADDVGQRPHGDVDASQHHDHSCVDVHQHEDEEGQLAIKRSPGFVLLEVTQPHEDKFDPFVNAKYEA